MDMTRIRKLLLVTLVLLVGGCGTSDSPNTMVDDRTAESTSDDATPTPGLTVEPGEANDAPAEAEVVSEEPTSEINAAHILIMHQNSERVPPGITRTKEEALTLAQEVALKAQADNADFAALAKQYSDGPSGPDGGNLGNFMPEQMVPAFSQATLGLTIGEVSDPVETQFGYHIIRRQEVQIIPKVSAKHILVMHAGSMRVPPNITRTREEAQARIQECVDRYRQGAQFESLAREYSDGPSGPNGGDLGEFPQGVMAPAFEQAAFACEVGKVTDVVETPFGFHIIYRYK